MSRILFLLVLLVVGFLLLKSIQRKINTNNNRASRQIKHSVRVIACQTCGLRVPESEAVQYRGKHFCSLEHAQQAQLQDQASQQKDHKDKS